jgi:hypothetical protein
MPTTVFPPNDNNLPQTHTLFAPPIRAIPALPPLPSAKPHHLQLDTAHMNPAVSRASSVSASTTLVDPSIAGSGNGPRRSSDSVRTMPGFRRDRSLQVQDRTRSMSATASSHAHARSSLQDPPAPNSSIARVRSSLQDYNPFSNASSLRPAPSRHVPSSPPAPSQHVHSSSPPIQYPHRSPLVYPALLSRVAEALRTRITLSDIVKDGLTYKNAFDGRQAVDKIAYIIKTTDRNLALTPRTCPRCSKVLPCRHV